MNNYLDFKKLSLYNTYIKNVKWNFNFMKDKICASTELNYRIYESKMLYKFVILIVMRMFYKFNRRNKDIKFM